MRAVLPASARHLPWPSGSLSVPSLGSAASELVFHVFKTIAPGERRLTAERARDCTEAARKHGKKPGRPLFPEENEFAAQRLIKAGETPGEAGRQWHEA